MARVRTVSCTQDLLDETRFSNKAATHSISELQCQAPSKVVMQCTHHTTCRPDWQGERAWAHAVA